MTEFSSVFGERFSNFLDYRTARGYKRGTYLLLTKGNRKLIT